MLIAANSWVFLDGADSLAGLLRDHERVFRIIHLKSSEFYTATSLELEQCGRTQLAGNLSEVVEVFDTIGFEQPDQSCLAYCNNLSVHGPSRDFCSQQNLFY